MTDVDDEALPTHPGARRPDRSRSVDSMGVRLAVHEWGSADAPPLLLAHGGFDFAGTFDTFAPLLADAGWRVVCWDQRGHGDSDHTALYQWDADILDAAAVLEDIGAERIPLVGHSKGGSLTVQLASAIPGRVSAVVNIDGLPSRRAMTDVQDHDRTKLLAGELAGWLDHRRSAVDNVRRPGTIAELAERRGRMNPRLSREWLEYLVPIGARHDADGWRWKIDPSLRLGGFGPWRPEWSLQRLAELSCPFLALLATEPEPMGWGTAPDDVEGFLPPGGRVEVIEGSGHFIHVEQPAVAADAVIEHLAPVMDLAVVR